MSTIDSYVINEAQYNSRSWTPTPYLDASPMQIVGGASAGDYIISVVLGDPAYDELRAWLDDNAERAEVPQGNLFPPWEIGVWYDVGVTVAYQGSPYIVIQAHTSQADWKPDIVPALYKLTVPEGEIHEWQQPTGAHDAYMKYDRVTYNGPVYESSYDANVHAPGVVSGGWVLV